MRRACVLLLLLLGAGGCYRTSYSNLAPPVPMSEREPPTTTGSRVPASPWRHFWVYGWAPGELVIDAAATCGGTNHVAQIETRQTFAQGLIAAFAGYYINIYSPYTGAVVCDNERRR